jgi:glycogen phosphorylase
MPRRSASRTPRPSPTRPSRTRKTARTKLVCPVPTDSHDGLDAESIQHDVLDNLRYVQGRFPEVATPNDWYLALAYTVRNRLLRRWTSTAHTYRHRASRTVCYLSAEFLLGPHLHNNIVNLGIEQAVRTALRNIGRDFDEMMEQEEEPGLGNGGLGRLAACYMDSLATLNIPAIGYGIRYEYGIFDQHIENGWQVEESDTWLRLGNPWEIPRPEIAYSVGFGGHTEGVTDADGRYRVRWVPQSSVRGVAYDTAILGYRTNTASMLRLWKAEGYQTFSLAAFNHGDYAGAVQQQIASETITRVLYPKDELLTGKRLRLQQQYLLVSCALRDMIRIHLQSAANLDNFHRKYAAQLNDTHPALSVTELMRLLVDEYGYEWDKAWDITSNTFAYTNHTLLPEALEKWPLHLLAELLPRHLEIVYEVNRRFLEEVAHRFPGDLERLRRMSLVDESGERYVRMANLACVGSYAVNGVAALHSELLKRTVLRDFYELWPDKFSNKTNGVTPRRFLVVANPGLAGLISGRIGESWVRDLSQLRNLARFADDREFRFAFRTVKLRNKQALADRLKKLTGVVVEPTSLFDVHVKRIHEYKRQHLNVLHVVTLYQRLRCNPGFDTAPRTVIFGGKAAPGYRQARLMIKLIHCVAAVINADPVVSRKLRVAFFPDFNVKNAQVVYPAADLSEQISTAGKEASGTGNMKFSLNGALTIGTLDGANVEIREEVGVDNFFLFGLSSQEVEQRKRDGYRPWEVVERDEELATVLRLIRDGHFCPEEPDLFRSIVDELTGSDNYMLLADYRSYVECQERVAAAFKDEENWSRMAILNVARMGKFSSDRAIREYAEDIWKVEPVDIVLDAKA